MRLAGQVEVRLALATQGELEFRAVLRARERRGDIDAVALAAALLASCVAVHANAGGGALYFVASDRRLLDAAAAEGIPNWDPASGVAAPALH